MPAKSRYPGESARDFAKRMQAKRKTKPAKPMRKPKRGR